MHIAGSVRKQRSRHRINEEKKINLLQTAENIFKLLTVIILLRVDAS
jgi:hypothetical protein